MNRIHLRVAPGSLLKIEGELQTQDIGTREHMILECRHVVDENNTNLDYIYMRLRWDIDEGYGNEINFNLSKFDIALSDARSEEVTGTVVPFKFRAIWISPSDVLFSADITDLRRTYEKSTITYVSYSTEPITTGDTTGVLKLVLNATDIYDYEQQAIVTLQNITYYDIDGHQNPQLVSFTGGGNLAVRIPLHFNHGWQPGRHFFVLRVFSESGDALIAELEIYDFY